MNDSEMTVAYHPTPWNKGKLIGQKPPFKLREIRALRTRLGVKLRSGVRGVGRVAYPAG